MKTRTLLAAAGLMIIANAIALAGDLPDLKIEKYELPNGLDVILHEDHTLPVVAVNIWYHVGSQNEKPGKTGFAHLFEHLMFQGSENHNMLFEEGISKIGGSNNGSTSEDRTNYWENVPGNYLEKILWLDADRMANLLPAIDQARLDNQRDVVKNERRERFDNQPYGRAYEEMLPLLFPENHPYSWSVIGSMTDLSAASLEDVSDFFRHYYAPNNASLCIAGDFNSADAKAWVEKYFGPIPPGPPVSRIESWQPTLSENRRIEMRDNVSLPRLYMSWHTPAFYAPGDAEFDILASILTSGKSSRLYKSLVYDKQIAQDVSAYQSSKELSSIFMIQVTAKEGVSLDEIEKEIDRVLEEIRKNGVTKDEFERAKTNWETSFVRSLQEIGDFGGRADRLNQYNIMLGDPNKLRWDRDRYTNAIPADIKRYAESYLKHDNRVIMSVYPESNNFKEVAKPDMKIEPGPTAEPAFITPKIERAALSNGIELMLVEDHKLPLIQFNLLLKSGWAADPVDRPGVAAITAELLNEGTQTRNALAISDEVQRLGASLESSSGYDNSSVTLNVLKRNLDPALNLMVDIVTSPSFPAEELERQRSVYLGRILQESKQPFATGFKSFLRELYGADHPYAEPYTGSGTAKSIKALTRDDLVKFYGSHYMPNNATAIMVGDITMAEAKAKLETAFGNWKQGPIPSSEVKQVNPLGKTKICIVDKPNAAQSVIILGNLIVPRASDDFLGLNVVTNALGGGSTGRLFMNLRQDKGYTYGAYSFATSRRGQGAFVCYAQVQTVYTKESLAEFMKELRDITGERPLSEKELDESKSNLVKKYPQNFETLSGTAGQLGSIATFGLRDDELAQYAGTVSKIDINAAMHLAQNYIHPDSLLIVVVGDRQKIEQGIKDLNIGEIIYLSPTDEMADLK